MATGGGKGHRLAREPGQDTDSVLYLQIIFAGISIGVLLMKTDPFLKYNTFAIGGLVSLISAKKENERVCVPCSWFYNEKCCFIF